MKIRFILFLIVALPAFSFGQVPKNNRDVNFPREEVFPEKMPEKENFWLFILAGQSNMAGRGFVEPNDTLANPGILSLNKNNQWVLAKEPLHFYQPKLTGLDCGMSFARELQKSVGDSIVIGLVPCAVGGSSVENWASDSVFNEVRLLSNFKEKAAYAKQSGIIKGILWHQGESDATPEKIASYKTKLQELFDHFREYIGNDSLPIILGELGTYSVSETRKMYWDSVNTIIRSIPENDPDCYVISSDGLTPNDDFIHFNSASQRELGRRYAQKFARIISGKKVE